MEELLQEGVQLWRIFKKLASLHVLSCAMQAEDADEGDCEGSKDVACSQLTTSSL